MSEVLVEEAVLDQLLAHNTISLGIQVSVILLTFFVLHIIYGMAIGVVAQLSMVRDYLSIW